MDKIENVKSEEEEVNVAMLENGNKAEELKDANQKAAKPEYARKQCKGSEAKRRMEYLRANKGLITTVVISAIIIFAVVIAMLATREDKGHGHSKVHNSTKMP